MTKGEIIKVLIIEFGKKGYLGGSMANISKITGLGKSSLYHYFPGGKQEMAQQILQAAHCWVNDELMKPIDDEPLTQAKIDLLFNKISDFYANGSRNCLIDIMSIEIEEEDPMAKNIIRLIVEDFVKIFEKLFLELNHNPIQARSLATQALIQLQGSLVLARALDKPEYFQNQILFIKQNMLKIQT